MRSAGQMPMVFSYGAPRSGTTFLQVMLDGGAGYAHRKLAEFGALHPCITNTGLIGIMSTAGLDKPIIVRILRHPLEIVESMYALRRPGANVGGIATATDETILGWIKRERSNTAEQKAIMAGIGWTERFVEVRYHDFSDVAARAAFIGRLVQLLPDPDFNRASFASFIKAHWDKDSVRCGRLAMGITESIVPEERKRWFAQELRTEIEADRWS